MWHALLQAFEQAVDVKSGSSAGGVISTSWAVLPKENRLWVFDGSLLLCILICCFVAHLPWQRRTAYRLDCGITIPAPHAIQIPLPQVAQTKTVQQMH